MTQKPTKSEVGEINPETMRMEAAFLVESASGLFKYAISSGAIPAADLVAETKPGSACANAMLAIQKAIQTGDELGYRDGMKDFFKASSGYINKVAITPDSGPLLKGFLYHYDRLAQLYSQSNGVTEAKVGDLMPNGTFTQPKTGAGMPDGTTADSSPALTFNQVKEYAQGLNTQKAHGYGDWRALTKPELNELINNEAKLGGRYWSSTAVPAPGNKEDAASVQQKPPTSPKPKP